MFPWLTTYVSTRKLPGRRNLKDVEYYTLFQLSTWGLRYDALALQWLIGEQTMAAGRRMLDQQEVPWMAGLRLRDNNSILTLLARAERV